MRRRRTALVLAVLGLLVAAAIATAAVSGSGEKPPAKPLAVAVHDALTAPAVPGVTARIRFTNDLISSGALPRGSASPLLSGATGRAWVARDGRFRLELQSADGDAQVVSDGRTLTVYDGRANKLYTVALPRERGTKKAEKRHGPPTLARVEKALARLGRKVGLSGAIPGNVAGQPAYEVTAAPRRGGGLVGKLALAWDAARGVPLRIALTAKGSSDPVLELEATDISYGAVPAADLAAPTAPGAKRERIVLRGHRRPAKRSGFAVMGGALPNELLGRRLQEVRRLKREGVVATYGRGLDGIAVVQGPARGRDPFGELQAVDVAGASGRELTTPLGTVISWARDGTRFTLIASQPKATVEAAARALP